MALVGAMIGLPMFFEIGLVLLIPVIILVARRSGLPLLRIAIPTLAGLSVMHGLVPPHPGPLVAVAALKANLGLTLASASLVAIPTVIIAGPVFSRFAARWVDVRVPDLFDRRGRGASTSSAARRPGRARPRARRRSPPPWSASCCPVVLMLAKALADVIAPKSRLAGKRCSTSSARRSIALTIAVIDGIIAARARRQDGQGRRSPDSWSRSLPPDRRHPDHRRAPAAASSRCWSTPASAGVIAKAVDGSGLSVLLLAWIDRGARPRGDRFGDGRHGHRGRHPRPRRARPVAARTSP